MLDLDTIGYYLYMEEQENRSRELKQAGESEQTPQEEQGQEYIIDGLCPPLCHELWHNIYPMVYALLNGAELDYDNTRARMFDAKCPDECRVSIHGEVIED